MKNLIPEVPSIELYKDINGLEGLRNLAGWIARYAKLEVIHVDGFSPVLRKLLTTGILVQFEPYLVGYTSGSLQCGQAGADDEYERYEFAVELPDFIGTKNENFAYLYFVFLANNKCKMLLLSSLEIEEAVERMFDALEIGKLPLNGSSRMISWHEGDVIIAKYLKYLDNPDIPSVE